MILPIILLFVVILSNIYASELIISSSILRKVHPHDVGLFFDMIVKNLAQPKESLLFEIHSKQCCLQVTQDDIICDRLIRMYGGEFGRLAPDKEMDVTLLLPTLVLHNRVGYCDVYLQSTKTDNTRIQIDQRLKFNTTVAVKSATVQMIAFKHVKTCVTRDLNPLMNCEPENCEDKYFGLRNFFNSTSQVCEPVPVCKSTRQRTSIYDYDTNQCIPLHHRVTAADIQKIKSGQFEDYVWPNKVTKRNASAQPTTNDSTLQNVLLNQYVEYGTITFYTLYGLAVFVILVSMFFFFATLMVCIIVLMNRCCKHHQPGVNKTEYDKLQ
jgi:hypothetical protein